MFSGNPLHQPYPFEFLFILSVNSGGTATEDAKTGRRVRRLFTFCSVAPLSPMAEPLRQTEPAVFQSRRTDQDLEPGLQNVVASDQLLALREQG